MTILLEYINMYISDTYILAIASTVVADIVDYIKTIYNSEPGYLRLSIVSHV